MEKWRVRFATWPPFTELSNNNETLMSGIVADLYTGLNQFMNFNYDLRVQPDLVHGRLLPNKTWIGMIGSMTRNETDISGPYFINYARSTAMQFSFPLAFCQLSIVSGVESTQRGAFLLLSIFSLQVWMSLFVTAAVVASTATAIYFSLAKPPRKEKLETFLRYMWEFLTALLGKGFGGNNIWHLKPVGSATSFRLLQALWCFVVCVVLMNTYQGTIMSTFAVDKPKAKIESLEDLVANPKMGVRIFRGSYVESVLSALEGTKYDSIWQRSQKKVSSKIDPKMLAEGRVPEWFENLGNGEDIYISEATYMKRLTGMLFRKTGKCKIRVTAIPLGSSYLGLGVRKQLSHTKFFENFNRGIMHFFEGVLSHEKMIRSTLHYEICSRDYQPEPKPLKQADVLGAFLILIVGILASVLILVVEILTTRIKMGTKRLK